MTTRKRRPKTIGIQTTVRNIQRDGISLRDERVVMLAFALNALECLGYRDIAGLAFERARVESTQIK